jgi:hypothetical protein
MRFQSLIFNSCILIMAISSAACRDQDAPPAPDLERTRLTGEVALDEGLIRGARVTAGSGERTAWAFTGIPFAEALAPDTRWTAPVAKGAWKPEILDATQRVWPVRNRICPIKSSSG